jgi:hypothetical protein
MTATITYTDGRTLPLIGLHVRLLRQESNDESIMSCTVRVLVLGPCRSLFVAAGMPSLTAGVRGERTGRA